MLNKIIWLLKKIYMSWFKTPDINVEESSTIKAGNVKTTGDFAKSSHVHPAFMPRGLTVFNAKKLAKTSGRQYSVNDFVKKRHQHNYYTKEQINTLFNKQYLTDIRFQQILPPKKEHVHDYKLKQQLLIYDRDTLTANKNYSYKILNQLNVPENKFVIKIGNDEYTGYVKNGLFSFNQNYFKDINVQETLFNHQYNQRYKEVLKLDRIEGYFKQEEYALLRFYQFGQEFLSETIKLNYNNGDLVPTKQITEILPGSVIGIKIDKRYLGDEVYAITIPSAIVNSSVEVFDDAGNRIMLSVINDRDKFDFSDTEICVRGIPENRDVYYILPFQLETSYGIYSVLGLNNGILVLNNKIYNVENYKARLPIIQNTINSVAGVKLLAHIHYVMETSQSYSGSIQPAGLSNFSHEHSNYSLKGNRHVYSKQIADIHNNLYSVSNISKKEHLHENVYISKQVAETVFLNKNASIVDANGISDHELKYKIGIFRYDITSTYDKGVDQTFYFDLYSAQSKGRMYLPNLHSIEITQGPYSSTSRTYLAPIRFRIEASMQKQLEACGIGGGSSSSNPLNTVHVRINITPESTILQKIQSIAGIKDLYEEFYIYPIKSQMVVNRVDVQNTDYSRRGMAFLSPSFTIGTLDNNSIFNAIASYRTKTFTKAIYTYSFEYNQEQLNHLGYAFGQFNPDGFSIYNFGLPFTVFALKEVKHAG